MDKTTEDTLLEQAQKAREKYSPEDFLTFLRGYRRDYDSDRLRREFDRMEREAQKEAS